MKVSKIKYGIEPGTEIPVRQNCGNIGRWAERQLKEHGHVINNGIGCDLPNYGVEVKTRKNESSSPHTMGSMKIEDIIATPYDQSPIFDKVQRQYRIHYSDEGQVVTDSQVYDFSEEYIQDKLREAYEIGRKRIARNEALGYHPPYVKGTAYGQFEITDSCNSYRFRIPHGKMKIIETISKNRETFKKFFD
jgi:hypothetical protein